VPSVGTPLPTSRSGPGAQKGVDSGHELAFHRDRPIFRIGAATAHREGQHGRELVIVVAPVLAQSKQQGMQPGVGDLGRGPHLQKEHLVCGVMGEPVSQGSAGPRVVGPGQGEQCLAAGVVIGVGQPCRQCVSGGWRGGSHVSKSEASPVPDFGLFVVSQADEGRDHGVSQGTVGFDAVGQRLGNGEPDLDVKGPV
jgi:hypothetical protein